jgi:hypothetical protein
MGFAGRGRSRQINETSMQRRKNGPLNCEEMQGLAGRTVE